jgi:hypothetical protein
MTVHRVRENTVRVWLALLPLLMQLGVATAQYVADPGYLPRRDDLSSL